MAGAAAGLKAVANLVGAAGVTAVTRLLMEKVSHSLVDRYKVMEGMEKQHEILKRNLPAILDVIADAEKQAPRREGVRTWLQKLKTVAYEAIELFDDFHYEALRREANKNGHVTALGIAAGFKFLATHNRLAFRLTVSSKLKKVVDTIQVLVTEMNAFGFVKLQLETPAWKEWRETDSIIVDPENIVKRSRHEERDKIVHILVSGMLRNEGLVVVPIVGMGGLGKTTLAQLIYNSPEVKEYFQLLKWVCVSDDFNVRNLANKICNSSETSLEQALQKLQRELRDKRYLLVLDDVWNKDIDKWEKLKECLQQGATGSCVLVTTRDKEIAEFIGTVVDKAWKNKFHEVSILRKEFIHEIIETRAFGAQNTKRKKLIELVGPISRRCCGSPLAAKALGSLLRHKTTKEEWEDVLQRSSICDDETGILPILKLSYDDLSADMKQCFAFCSLYPKNYQIDVDELILLWIAHGFISDQRKVPAETVGKRVVNEMVSRSFFQYEKQISKKHKEIGCRSKTFLKIHDLMHDVALSAAENECICMTEEMSQGTELLPATTRHLYVKHLCMGARSRSYDVLYRSVSKMSLHVQTLMSHTIWEEDELHLSKHNSLRALSMKIGLSHLEIKPEHLLHLRYLDVSDSEIEALPDNISILYHLQTLKLSGCKKLKRLPMEMKYMTALRHLHTEGCWELECMPPELGRLTSLQTVTYFVVGSGSNFSSLGELENLNIGGSLILNHLENVTEATHAKQANLGNKKELSKLSLQWTSGKEEEHQCHEVLEALEAHDGLLSLEIHSYQGSGFPEWMGMSTNMVELRLFHCRKTKQLPPLCQMPALQILHVEGLEKLQFLCSNCTSSTLRKLKELKLVNLDDFERFWQVQEELVAFPLLKKLEIRCCKRLAALPKATVLKKRRPKKNTVPTKLHYTMARSAFPKLKRLYLSDLPSFEKWDAALEIEEEQPAFPELRIALIEKCPQLTSLPRAPKLKGLELVQANEKVSQVLSTFSCLHAPTFLGLPWVDFECQQSSLSTLVLSSCNFFFQSHALQGLWDRFGKLHCLQIDSCHELVHWPEKVFQCLFCLRELEISDCHNLIGYAAEATSERCQILPSLESLHISRCPSLVEICNVIPTKKLFVTDCAKVELIFSKQQHKTSSDQGPSTHVMASSLDLSILSCDGLSEVHNLPSSIREIIIIYCSKLRVLSGQVDALKVLKIDHCPQLESLESCIIKLPMEVLRLLHCKSLVSLPSGPQDYSSLYALTIKGCPGIKKLPEAMQLQLDRIKYKVLDAYLEGRSGPRQVRGAR